MYFLPQVAKSLPRICFLSGLSGEEMMVLIDAFPETGIGTFLTPDEASKLHRIMTQPEGLPENFEAPETLISVL